MTSEEGNECRGTTKIFFLPKSGSLLQKRLGYDRKLYNSIYLVFRKGNENSMERLCDEISAMFCHIFSQVAYQDSMQGRCGIRVQYKDYFMKALRSRFTCFIFRQNQYSSRTPSPKHRKELNLQCKVMINITPDRCEALAFPFEYFLPIHFERTSVASIMIQRKFCRKEKNKTIR